VIKTFALIVRRPDHTREAFRKHYEEIHVPTALPLVQGLARYVRYHLEEEIHGTPIFDVISGFWYPSGEEAAATVARIDSPEGEKIRADERSFMDKERNVILPVAARQRLDSDEGDQPVFVLVRAPRDDREAWLADYDAKQAPALLEALEAPRFALDHTTAQAGPHAPAWDRVTEFASEGLGSFHSWIAGLEPTGAGICAVQTRRHETNIGTPDRAAE
jgi:uncharacterized protein (TIGR02118 family)